MVRGSAGGGSRRDGDRGLSRRRIVGRVLCATTLLCVLTGPPSARGASESDAWLNARRAWITQSAAIDEAARHLAKSSSADDVRELRRAVADAIHEFDALEVHDCFRVWWSYVRTSFLLFDQALIGMEKGDLGQVQVAVSSSRYLAAQARTTEVDCSGKGLAPTGLGSARRAGDSRGLATPPAIAYA
jgi:hypothetical protein